jgi:hypothetical protein
MRSMMLLFRPARVNVPLTSVGYEKPNIAFGVYSGGASLKTNAHAHHAHAERKPDRKVTEAAVMEINASPLGYSGEASAHGVSEGLIRQSAKGNGGSILRDGQSAHNAPPVQRLPKSG